MTYREKQKAQMSRLGITITDLAKKMNKDYFHYRSDESARVKLSGYFNNDLDLKEEIDKAIQNFRH